MGILFKNLEEEVSAPRPVVREPQPRAEVPQAQVATPKPAEKARPAYTVDDAIALMRSLPLEQNEDIIVRVVRSVWSTMRVSVTDIVEDANRREKDLTNKVTALGAQVRDLEGQIASRRDEIVKLESDLREIVLTRERLSKADVETAEPADVVEGVEAAVAAPTARSSVAPSSTRARITREEVPADPTSAQSTVLLGSKRLTPPPPPRRP